MSASEQTVRIYDLGPENPAEAQVHYERMSPEDRIAELLHRDQTIRKLHEESRSDALTGVLNRRGFEEAYAFSAARHNRQDSDKPDLLVMIDLDRFKQVNDAGGHEAGDVALQQIAGILGISLREDDVIGRLGGDEFGALLHNATLEEGNEIFERIRFNVETFHRLKHERGSDAIPDIPTLSVGIAEIDYSKSLKQMADYVDAALYEAKEAGRNKVHIVQTT